MRASGSRIVLAASLLAAACSSPNAANGSETSETGETAGEGDGDGDAETGDETGDGDGDGDPGGVSCADDPNQTTIPTRFGPVAGVAGEDGVTRFLAIPYAAAPIGELRFRPPEPPEPWTEPRGASSFGPTCVQLVEDPAQGGATGGDEDCLQLNVWTPQACEGADLPVLLFIHGGGNAIGSGTDPLYDGAKLAAASGAVIVTINYRLGALGWLAIDALDGEDPDHPEAVAGNYGLRDQLAALEWVAANIARFGGDSERVTVFGESAGAVNTCALIGAPAAAGKFAGAIVQSGTCLQPTRAQVEPLGAELLASAGCDGVDAADVPACLRAIPAAELIALAPTGYPSVAGLGRGWGPHVDGVVLPETTLAALASGRPGVPLVVGSNRDETAKDTPPTLDAATYEALIQATFLVYAPQVLAAYPLTDYPDPATAWAALTTDFKFVCNARKAAVASASGGAPTWRYQFSYDAYTALPGTPKSAFHGLELVFLFGNYASLFPGVEYPPNPDDLAIAASLQERWGQFAATGEFEGPAYEPGVDPYVELDVPIGAGEGLRTAQCDFWDQLF